VRDPPPAAALAHDREEKLNSGDFTAAESFGANQVDQYRKDGGDARDQPKW
jgi:hypothetical protein